MSSRRAPTAKRARRPVRQRVSLPTANRVERFRKGAICVEFVASKRGFGRSRSLARWSTSTKTSLSKNRFQRRSARSSPESVVTALSSRPAASWAGVRFETCSRRETRAEPVTTMRSWGRPRSRTLPVRRSVEGTKRTVRPEAWVGSTKSRIGSESTRSRSWSTSKANVSAPGPPHTSPPPTRATSRSRSWDTPSQSLPGATRVRTCRRASRASIPPRISTSGTSASAIERRSASAVLRLPWGRRRSRRSTPVRSRVKRSLLCVKSWKGSSEPPVSGKTRIDSVRMRR